MVTPDWIVRISCPEFAIEFNDAGGDDGGLPSTIWHAIELASGAQDRDIDPIEVLAMVLAIYDPEKVPVDGDGIARRNLIRAARVAKSAIYKERSDRINAIMAEIPE